MKFLRTFCRSFYDPTLYAEAREQSKDNGLLYAFSLVAFTTFIASVVVIYKLHMLVMVGHEGKPAVFDDVARQIAQQLPGMTVLNGELSVEGRQPLKIYVQTHLLGEDMAGYVATIDTTGATSYRTMDTPILITRTETISRNGDANNEKIEINPHSKFFGNDKNPKSMTHEQFVQGVEDFIAVVHAKIYLLYLFVGGFMYLFLTFGFFLLRIVMLLALGVVAVIFGNASAGSRGMDFRVGLLLASLAYTPVAVFSGASFLLLLDSPRSPVLFALGSLMLLCTISASRRSA